jgi:mannonate dehydratase
VVLFAFERAHHENGEPDLEHTIFHVPDRYARDVAQKYAEDFEWVASIHPYRKDALDALEQAKQGGARGVKWLPSAMGIDPASPRCDRFYEGLQKANLALIAHAGLERAVLGREAHDFGTPFACAARSTPACAWVVAHCASIGEDRDLDKGRMARTSKASRCSRECLKNTRTPMATFRHDAGEPGRAGAGARDRERRVARAPAERLRLSAARPDAGVLGRLPGVAQAAARERRAGAARYPHAQPLLFDFVLKRTLRSNGKSFATGVFETRAFFMR